MSKERKLSPRAMELLNEPNEVRIEHIKKPMFLTYPRAAELLDEMEDLLAHPKTNRMPNMLIVARSNNGKTEILAEFLARHPAEARLGQDTVYSPVVHQQCPPKPSEGMFITEMLLNLGVQSRGNEAWEIKLARLIDVLGQVKTKVLMLDEVNHLLGGSVTRQRFFLNLIKYLSNELKISIVATGTKDALQAMLSDAQMQSRFPARMLPRWQENEDFRRMLATFEYTLPLREPSEIYKGELARKIYGISDGILGDVAAVLRSAAKVAIETGIERITVEAIDQCPYVRRKRYEDVDCL